MTAQHHPTLRPQNAGDEMLTLQEACAFLRVPEGTLGYWRHLGSGPRSFKQGLSASRPMPQPHLICPHFIRL